MRTLVKLGGWTDNQVDAIAKHIHYWTGGQPYLTQFLCSHLSPGATSADVDADVKRLRHVEPNHLPHLLKRLNRDDRLRMYVDRIQAGERIIFSPLLNPRQARLELLGVIKADDKGFCVIRNRIYEQVLEELEK